MLDMSTKYVFFGSVVLTLYLVKCHEWWGLHHRTDAIHHFKTWLVSEWVGVQFMNTSAPNLRSFPTGRRKDINYSIIFLARASTIERTPHKIPVLRFAFFTKIWEQFRVVYIPIIVFDQIFLGSDTCSMQRHLMDIFSQSYPLPPAVRTLPRDSFFFLWRR